MYNQTFKDPSNNNSGIRLDIVTQTDESENLVQPAFDKYQTVVQKACEIFGNESNILICLLHSLTADEEEHGGRESSSQWKMLLNLVHFTDVSFYKNLYKTFFVKKSSPE